MYYDVDLHPRPNLDAPAPCGVEDVRLAALDRYDILDTPAEEAFDRVTRLVRRIMQVRIATITLIDGHRQWFKSKQGIDLPETDRRPAFCNVTIRGQTPLVVPDTHEDERFRDNPFVVGEPHVRFYAGAPLLTPEGQGIGALCAIDTEPRVPTSEQLESLADLARIVMSELELRAIATTDSLTGSLSRRAFRDEAARALALATRHRHSLSCIALDLDHFKAINDAWGHAAGDHVLTQTVETCHSVLRKSDLLGRVGGEEFAIVLPHTGLAAALEVAEKLREAIEAKRVDAIPGGGTVTASFGVAALDRSVRDVDTLFQRADEALLDAKSQGRNRCRIWEPPQEVTGPAMRRVFKAGRIAFNGGRSTIDCTVRGLSDEGAAFDVVSTATIPDRFKLTIESEGSSRLCSITSKTERHIAARFE